MPPIRAATAEVSVDADDAVADAVTEEATAEAMGVIAVPSEA